MTATTDQTPTFTRRPRALDDVATEREAIDAKWGEQNHPDGTGPQTIPLYDHASFLNLLGSLNDMTLGYASENAVAAKLATDQAAHTRPSTLKWRNILIEEVFEALAEDDPALLRAELVQVAAVAISWVEAIDRRTEAPPLTQDEHDVVEAFGIHS